MPRERRSFQPGVVYHLISRFVDRKYFVTKSLERGIYLKLHRKALKRSDWKLLAYAIMSNHIHLAAIAGNQSLHSWLRRVHSPFAGMLNDAHERIGPVFVRGPSAFPVVDARVGHLIAYIHNNPVRAGVHRTAIESNWTSHQAYVGAAQAPSFLAVSRGLALTGLTANAFDEWVNDPVQRADRSFSEEAHQREIDLAEEQALLADIPHDEVAAAIVSAAAVAVGVPMARVRGDSRGNAEVTARAAAVHCSGLLGLSGQRIATALNLSQQRVSVLRRQHPSNDARAIAARVYDGLCGQAK